MLHISHLRVDWSVIFYIVCKILIVQRNTDCESWGYYQFRWVKLHPQLISSHTLSVLVVSLPLPWTHRLPNVYLFMTNGFASVTSISQHMMEAELHINYSVPQPSLLILRNSLQSSYLRLDKIIPTLSPSDIPALRICETVLRHSCHVHKDYLNVLTV